MATDILMGRLRSYRLAHERLKEARESEFKPGRAVQVNHERYHGYGLIVTDEGCPLDQLAVKLENGNTWWYPIEHCMVARRDACPRWLQKAMQAEPKTTIRKLAVQP